MTKKDYILMASVIKTTFIDQGTRNMLVLALCRELKERNAFFDPSLFIKACGAEHSVLLALQ